MPTIAKKKNDLSWVSGYFEGEDVYIIGGGNSLRQFHLDDRWSELEGKRVIAINNAYLYAPCDILLFLDAAFPALMRSRGHKLSEMSCKVMAGWSSALWPEEVAADNLSVFRPWREPSLDIERGLFSPLQGGASALNLALICKAKRVFLLGLDCRYIAGRGHFYSTNDTRPADEVRYLRVAGKANEKGPNVNHYEGFKGMGEIYNASPDSAIDTFPKITIDEALKGVTICN